MAKRKAQKSNTQSILITVAVVVASVAILGASTIGSIINQLSDTVVTVNGEKVTKPYYNFFLFNQKQMAEQNGPIEWDVPSTDGMATQTDMAKDSALQGVASMKIHEQQAEARGLTLTAEETEQVETMLTSYKTAPLDDAAMQRLGMTDDMLREILSNQMLSNKLYDEVTKDVVVNPEEFEAFFQDYLAQNPGALTQVNADIIHTHSMEEAMAAKAEIDAGADFMSVLQQWNISHDEVPVEYASSLISSGSHAPEIVSAAMALLPGDVSEPVEVPNSGVDIIRANSFVDQDEAEIRAQQEETYLAQQKDMKYQEELTVWETEADVQNHTNYDLIAAMRIGGLSPAPTPVPAQTPAFDPLTSEAPVEGETVPEEVPVEGETVPEEVPVEGETVPEEVPVESEATPEEVPAE